VIQDWWKEVKQFFVKEYNFNEPSKNLQKDIRYIVDVPLNSIYGFLIKKRLV
jgi:hypothetical protein